MPWVAESLVMSEGLWQSEGGTGARSVHCPTARGRGQLEWDSGQLAQRGLQTGAGDCRFSSSLLACRFLLSFCDLCTLELSASTQASH